MCSYVARSATAFSLFSTSISIATSSQRLTRLLRSRIITTATACYNTNTNTNKTHICIYTCNINTPTPLQSPICPSIHLDSLDPLDPLDLFTFIPATSHQTLTSTLLRFAHCVLLLLTSSLQVLQQHDLKVISMYLNILSLLRLLQQPVIFLFPTIYFTSRAKKRDFQMQQRQK